ncbi:UDP-N-acetylmuramate dehydrogenase [Pontibacillus sp. ALD_SL1]|uniref:UDP-N-acetylmuramate dehydrogenase n=1 Tax=Pontibacillus sp. ALD_SL1 TaxID=2777185 RepID=UPI001A973D56|nr:UDP-N-acetylmuramate dehydrogenase [Pontibacillus sp. ALD_SL1]QST01497.1 UDP-N-acetylmuramate dehydrogenase [Pontibacillus sp. ALD_SL1]
MQEILTILEKQQVGKVSLHEPLSKHTTIKIGGPADLFIEPYSVEGLKHTLDVLHEHGVTYRVIGRGSNLLIPDEGIRGAVIKLGTNFDELHELEGNRIRVAAGYPIIKLATVLSRKGLRGLTFAGGIPGSVGGAVYMNAGAHGADISQILTKARVLTIDGQLKWLTKDEMKFSYRTSVLQTEKPGICVEAEFQLEPENKEVLMSEMKNYKDYRRETQPWRDPCAGSIFRNPLPTYAGKLVEEAGLKGYQIGGAKISELHGNFIVNTRDASYEDVLALIFHIQKTIAERYRVDLHTEVEIVGT